MRMKDSGVKWIGQMPEDWGVVFLSSLFIEHKQKNIGMQNNNLLSLSYGKIKRKDINTTDGLLPESFENYNIVDIGDIVLRLTDLQNDQRSLRTGLVKEKGIVTSAYVTLRKRNNNLCSDFMHYFLYAFDINKGFYAMGSGVRQGLNYDGIRKLEILFPFIDVQQKIVGYLDEKCAKIDNLIANQQAQIEKLKEYKQAVITEAVTKGLDKSEPMKDSGVEWIGQIPEKWIKIKHKILFKNISIKGYGDAIVLSLYRDYGVIPKDSRDDNFNVTSLDTNSYKYVQTDDLVINKMKAWSGSLAISNYEGIVSPAYYTCKVNYKYVTKRFIHHYLRNRHLVALYEMYSAGLRTGQWDLAIEDFQNIEIIIPPTLEEQNAIAKFIDKKCADIDSLISIKQQKIEKLQEYKKSLIYEYVTGKKEVV